MGSVLELALPELGEGIETVDVTAVLVSAGDVIRRDQPVIEVETEKASLEVPSTFDGRITELLVKPGDQLAVGQVILRADSQAAAESEAPPKEEPPPEPVAEVAPPPQPTAPPAAGGAQQSAPVIAFPAPPHVKPTIGPTVAAPPSARALARQLGVEIAGVTGTGPGGRISRDDVKRYAKSIITGMHPTGSIATAVAVPLPDFQRWGEIERQPLGSLRRATARNMARAWSTVPHVTQFDQADITQLESMRKRYNKRPEVAERRLSLTAIVIKLAASVLRQYPKFNASLDLQREELILKHYYNIGCAVDTERGLLVPVIRDVDKKTLNRVSAELNDLASRARDKKLAPDEMQGATFTVSNLGGLGTTYFSPIVNWPEVSILGVGRARNEAVFVAGQFQPRLILPLSLSYDHRLIDGADAARCLRWLAEALEQPLLLLLDE